MDLCANNYQISTEKGTKYEIELSSKTDRDRGSCHFCSVMTSPKLLICTSMIKFRKSCSFRVFFKAVFNLKHGGKNSQLIGFNKIKSLIYNILPCANLDLAIVQCCREMKTPQSLSSRHQEARNYIHKHSHNQTGQRTYQLQII